MPTSIELLQADWQQNYARYTDVYQQGESSYIPRLLPQMAVQFSVFKTLGILHSRLGNDLLRRALDPTETIASPMARRPDGAWLKRSNMVGINVRTVGSFWNVINYVLTIPDCHDSIHLLPIWEPGVVGSLYGMVSWQINPEFFNVELAKYVPALDTVEKQLKVVTNLLHAMGRTVGLDVIPHNDRFSEMALVYPRFFEWVRRSTTPPIMLTDQTEGVYKAVEAAIWNWLTTAGFAHKEPHPITADVFFDPQSYLTDAQRHAILFGYPGDYGGRLNRRLQLIQQLVKQGLETVPMTMAPPYRGLHINPESFVVDDYNQKWYQYEFDEPQAMSRVFGPLTRYKFHHSKDDNRYWVLDFDRPNHAAWNYVCQKYYDCQRAYNFDFMRGDMAHVQMRPDGVPASPDAFYDPLLAIKQYIHQQGVTHFAFFAETFLVEPDYMGYGDEFDHLEAIEADSTLGDLQSAAVTSPEFTERFVLYDNLLRTRRFAPNFTVMTADKDDPRFDEFYRSGNVFRYFTALFLTDMPSYVGLGFEVRNPHLTRGANEEYTKLYVFQVTDETETDKVTHGPFVWGQNGEQFTAIDRIRAFAQSIWPDIQGKETAWLLPPGSGDILAWTHAQRPQYRFFASLTGILPATIDGMHAGEILFETDGCRVVFGGG